MKRKNIVVVAFALVLVLASLAILSIHGVTQPVQNEPDLVHWNKYGVVVSAADLGVSIMEDFVMFYGHDGYVYAFLAAGSTYEFSSIYLIRGYDIYFHNLTVIGKVLNDPRAGWEDLRIRPRSVVYDAENSRYLLYYDGMGSQIAFASGVLSCPTSEFPQGNWTESSQNPILVPEYGGEGLMVLKKYGTYMGIFYGGYSAVSYKFCFSNDPLAKFTVVGDIAYRGSNYGQLRGLLKVDAGYLFAYEAEFGGRWNWRICLGFIDESLRFMSEHQHAPAISPTETYEGDQLANPYLSESSDMILLYYNGHPNDVFSNVILAYTFKP
jgi:hypothetical protein